MPSSALTAMASGAALGLALIVAIGAQNAFVLRQGLRGEHVRAVVAVCVVSDVLLILAGVAGAASVLDRLPELATVVRLAGAVFLLGYGLAAARRAYRSASLRPSEGDDRRGLMPVVGTSLALTWLNPHVYLDTVVLVGSVSASYEHQRWWFGAGAGGASSAWFAALGYGAGLLRPVFARPVAWRILDGVIAAVMIGLAGLLVLGAGES